MSKGKEEGKEKEKVKEAIIARPLTISVSKSLGQIYGNFLLEAEKLFTLGIGSEPPALDKILERITTDPAGAYKKLIVDKGLDDGIFIKLIVTEEIPSPINNFTFGNKKYLTDLVKKGNFNLQDPMLLAYAVRLSNEEFALSVTKELVSKGAVIADNILFHSYNNPNVTKFLLIEKPSIITCQDKLMGTDAVIKKVQGKLFTSASETDKVKFKTTLELLKAAKIGGDDLNIKLDIICPTHFSQDVSSTTSTTTTSVSTTSSFEKAFDSSSFSSTSESYTTKTAIPTTSSSNSDSLITLSSTTISLVSKEGTSEVSLAGDDGGTTGESATVDAA
jgi:hypothetical protein